MAIKLNSALNDKWMMGNFNDRISFRIFMIQMTLFHEIKFHITV